MSNIVVADFETTTSEDDCRVWGWGVYNIYCEIFEYGRDIDSFFRRVFSMPDKTMIYFHNLKFDGEFCFYWLYKNGFNHSKERYPENKEFTTLITHSGVFYGFNVRYRGKTYIFRDSLKVIPLSVSQISRSFGLEQLKGEIDYNKERPINYRLTEEEVRYIQNDVEIVGKALLFFLDQDLDRMTQASNCFKDFKSVLGKQKFEKYFPLLPIDSELRQSYKGGYTYVNPKFQNKEVGRGVVFDVNSLYPAVMYYENLPYGHPIFYEGQYEDDKLYNVYIQMFRCNFELKEGYLPTLQLKNTIGFIPTEYVESSEGLDTTLCLTSVDLELFFKHYDVYNIEWFGGWKFKSTNTIFREYIDKWIKVKEESTVNGNEGMRTISKLMLNALYGKFAINPKVIGKIPHYNRDKEMVDYITDDPEERDPIYVAIASFITSYARLKTISSAQNNYDRFIYADTDSLHLVGEEMPEDLDIDPVKLGAWDFEGQFIRGRFIRAKSYIEELYITVDEFEKLKENKKKGWEYNEEENVYTQIKVTCAGLPHKCHDQITYENFKSGLVVGGKLQHKRVKGGVILKDIDFTIKV